jgi:heme A synthase
MTNETRPRTSAALTRWSRVLVGATLVLLFAGANVTTTRSGDAVPSWPEPFWPHDPTLPAIIELSHRYAVPLVAVSMLAVAWRARRDERPAVRKTAWFGVALVLVQASLGGIRVLLVSNGIAENPSWIKIVHAGTAEVFFCVAVALMTALSPSWRAAKPRELDANAMSVIRMAILGTALLFVQAMLGAFARHGVLPREVHAFFALAALAVTAKLVLAGGFDVGATAEEIRRPAVLLGVLAAAQVGLGIATYFIAATGAAPESREASQVVVMNLHLAAGAAMLGTTFSILMRAVRVFGLPTDERVAAAERAAAGSAA